MALFGIRYYCFSLHVIKGQLVPLSSSYSGSTMSLFPPAFSDFLPAASYFLFWISWLHSKRLTQSQVIQFPGNTVSFFSPHVLQLQVQNPSLHFAQLHHVCLRMVWGYHTIISFKTTFQLVNLSEICILEKCVRKVCAHLQIESSECAP